MCAFFLFSFAGYLRFDFHFSLILLYIYISSHRHFIVSVVDIFIILQYERREILLCLVPACYLILWFKNRHTETIKTKKQTSRKKQRDAKIQQQNVVPRQQIDKLWLQDCLVAWSVGRLDDGVFVVARIQCYVIQSLKWLRKLERTDEMWECDGSKTNDCISNLDGKRRRSRGKKVYRENESGRHFTMQYVIIHYRVQDDNNTWLQINSATTDTRTDTEKNISSRSRSRAVISSKT